MVEGGGFVQHWAAMAGKRDNPQSGFANHIKNTHKVVFTKTLKELEWENAVLAKGDLAEEVNRLKAANGKNIIAYGGATFDASLIKAGLVDEFHLIVNLSALGAGMAIFNQISRPLNMPLAKATPYACGIVVLQYKKDGAM